MGHGTKGPPGGPWQPSSATHAVTPSLAGPTVVPPVGHGAHVVESSLYVTAAAAAAAAAAGQT
jgi:hypothetical protein